MEWEGFNGKNIRDYYGFVYEIKNKINGRYYIGKKFFWRSNSLKPLKGRKNKRHKKVESDWKEYWGSSNELLSDIEKFGKENFERKILRLCKNKWECAYYELEEQVLRGVMFDEYSYNGIINCRLKKLKEYEWNK